MAVSNFLFLLNLLLEYWFLFGFFYEFFKEFKVDFSVFIKLVEFTIIKKRLKNYYNGKFIIIKFICFKGLSRRVKGNNI